MKHLTSLLIVLTVVWWILSGYTYPLLLSLGAVSILFTVYLAHRMNVVDAESHPMHISVQLLRYWVYLVGQILLSNIKMVKIILSPNPDIDPRIIRVRTRQNSELGRVVLGNSVTLTPGTVTVDIRGDELEIHALNGAIAADVERGEMDRRVPGDVEGEA
ncbi:MAG: Na+/H+ antiporter subunit E [Pseudohongiellaceae bacterium]